MRLHLQPMAMKYRKILAVEVSVNAPDIALLICVFSMKLSRQPILIFNGQEKW